MNYKLARDTIKEIPNEAGKMVKNQAKTFIGDFKRPGIAHKVADVAMFPFTGKQVGGAIKKTASSVKNAVSPKDKKLKLAEKMRPIGQIGRGLSSGARFKNIK